MHSTRIIIRCTYKKHNINLKDNDFAPIISLATIDIVFACHTAIIHPKNNQILFTNYV